MNMQTIIAAVVMVINSIGDVVDSWRVASYRVNFIGNLWNVAKNPSQNIFNLLNLSIYLFVYLFVASLTVHCGACISELATRRRPIATLERMLHSLCNNQHVPCLKYSTNCLSLFLCLFLARFFSLSLSLC